MLGKSPEESRGDKLDVLSSSLQAAAHHRLGWLKGSVVSNGPRETHVEMCGSSHSDWGTGEEPEASATDEATEIPAEPDEEVPQADPIQANLLDRLLYKGVLPRYAFPTDVATFYVFDKEKSSSFRPEFLFSPSQGLPVALSQY